MFRRLSASPFQSEYAIDVASRLSKLQSWTAIVSIVAEPVLSIPWVRTVIVWTGFKLSLVIYNALLGTDRYNAALEGCKQDIEPVELYGPAGSVIFWHHRLMHSASRNRGTSIRSGVIYDFCAHVNRCVDPREPCLQCS